MSVDEVDHGLESLRRGILHIDHLLLFFHWPKELFHKHWADTSKKRLVSFDSLARIVLLPCDKESHIRREVRVRGKVCLPVGVHNRHLVGSLFLLASTKIKVSPKLVGKHLRRRVGVKYLLLALNAW